MIETLQQFAAAAGGRLQGPSRAFRELAIDSRKLAAGDLFVALRGAHVDGHDFLAAALAAGAAGALVSRLMPVALPQIIVDDVEAALLRAAMAARSAYAGTVIGVAGSNGKTTVKEMIAAILVRGGPCLATRGNLNNHLGVPLTLLRLREADRYAVIELGANHAGDVRQLAAIARPAVGVITNAGAEHLEGFGSLEGAARAEGELVEGLDATSCAVINADDAFASLWRGLTRARVITFGLQEGDFRASAIRADVGPQGFLTRFTLHAPAGTVPIELALAGRHNVYNALAAAACAVVAGAALSDVATGLAAMRAVAGRLQFRLADSGAWLIDDSYNANPSSLQAALQVLADLPGRRWLVLGDMAELGEFADASHEEAAAQARAAGVERIYSLGGMAAQTARAFGTGAQSFTDAAALLQQLRRDLTADVRVLIKGSRVNRLERIVSGLSTACALQSGTAQAKAG